MKYIIKYGDGRLCFLNLSEIEEELAKSNLPENRKDRIIAVYLLWNRDVRPLLNPNLTDDQFDEICFSKYDNAPYQNGLYSTDQMRYIERVLEFSYEIADKLLDPTLSLDDMKKITDGMIKAGAKVYDNTAPHITIMI